MALVVAVGGKSGGGVGVMRAHQSGRGAAAIEKRGWGKATAAVRTLLRLAGRVVGAATPKGAPHVWQSADGRSAAGRPPHPPSLCDTGWWRPDAALPQG